MNGLALGNILAFDAWELLREEGVALNAYSTGTYTETADTRSTWTFALMGKSGLPWAAPGGMTMLPNIGG